MSESASTVESALEAIRTYRFHYADEDSLQRGLTEALERAGLAPERERRIVGGRIDILLAERVGIEVKCAGSNSEVYRQLRRYSLLEDADTSGDRVRRLAERILSQRPRGARGSLDQPSRSESAEAQRGVSDEDVDGGKVA